MKRGDVVLVDWPYSDRTGSKLRPAVVVQTDLLNGLIDDTILVQITRTMHGIPGTEVVLDPTQETTSGLSHVSFASCANLLTADPALIDQTIGSLSDSGCDRSTIASRKCWNCRNLLMDLRVMRESDPYLLPNR